MADKPGSTLPEPLAVPSGWDELRRELARDVDRVADRLRGLSQARLKSQARLGADAPPHQTRAEAARAAAQTLADAAAGLEASAETDPPTWRGVPELTDFAVGDQIAVTGHDLVAASVTVAPDAAAWTRDGRRTAHEVLATAATNLAALRRAL